MCESKWSNSVSSMFSGLIPLQNAESSRGIPNSSGDFPVTIAGNMGPVKPSNDLTLVQDSSPNIPLNGSIASNLRESQQIIKKVSLSPM